MATGPNPSEHRAMGWAAIGAALVAIGGVGGGTLATVGASSHLWGDKAFLAGFAAACFLTVAGVYVLIAEFIGGLPLPPTRHEREARRGLQASQRRRVAPSTLDPARVLRRPAEPPPPEPKRRSAASQPKRSGNHNALVVELVEARQRLFILRDRIAPPKSYAASSSVLAPILRAKYEQEVRALAWGVRLKLADAALEWAVESLDEGIDLPPAGSLAGIAKVAPDDDLVTFIDEKRDALHDIVQRIGGTGAGAAASANEMLKNDLARLHSQGCSIRDWMRPAFGTETVGELTGRVREWNGTVQRLLYKDSPRSLLTFDAEPFPEPEIYAIPMQADSAARKRLVEFMDRKLDALAAIIKDVEAGR